MTINSVPHQYSTLFSTLYDEDTPQGQGHLGYGSHHSIFKCMENRNVIGILQEKLQEHNFGIIWDTDHDARIIEVVERIYKAQHLYPILFIGESKGMLSIILDSTFFQVSTPEFIDKYKKEIELMGHGAGDSWSVEFGSMESQEKIDSTLYGRYNLAYFASCNEERAMISYFRWLTYVWQIGLK